MIERYAGALVARARVNARNRRNLPFELTKDDVLALLAECKWKCAVTRTPFSFEKIRNQRPFAPSIDRIDCDAGYVKTNCRIVCVAANYAMNTWGESVLRTMAKHMNRAKPLDTVQCSIGQSAESS
jgi:hypothetical protein